jgi:inner membrane transporter RhtA
VAALLGLLLLGEHLSPVQWFAIGCIITASVGCAMTVRQAVLLQEGGVVA